MAAHGAFEGERANALAAASRLAARHGLTLEEAARGAEPPPPRPSGRARERAQSPAAEAAERRFAQAMHAHDFWVRADKARREEALREARARGLDEEERRRERARQAASHRRRSSNRRMAPDLHADVLLRETHLSLGEIASITGLDVWHVAGMKLKLRPGERRAGIG